jgi:CRISPR-associated endonuclease Csn1
MYLFSGDYIKVFDSNGKCKFSGFFKFSTILGGKQQRILGAWNNKPYVSSRDYLTLSKTDTVKKYHVDILGHIGGEIKCGKPLSLLKEKK